MTKKLLTNKWLLIGLGFIALIGLISISYKGVQTSKAPIPPKPTPVPLQPKTATMLLPTKDKPVTGQIIVKFKPQYTAAQINAHLQKYHASIIKTIPGINQTVVKVPAGQENAVAQKLKYDPYVISTQRDYTTHAFFIPDDPGFPLQYGLDNRGQSIQGRIGIAKDDIGAVAAWDITRGNGVKVAVLDTGINLTQPDLAGKVVAQKSFVSATVEDGNGHGTHVAGIIAADTNNGIGVAGVCPGCKLVIGKVLDDTGTGTTSNAVAGIVWAADQGAKVINVSFGTTDPQTAPLYLQAVTYAMQKGAVVVAAAGNDGTAQANYPAATTGVISVAATNNKNQKTSYSNYGSYVKIAAPGDNILSTAPTHSFALEPFGYTTASPYMYLSGTSMSAPIVAGVAALVASTQYGTTPQAIINRLYTTADKINGTGGDWTYGMVDAAKAVGTTKIAISTSPSQPSTSPLYCIGGAGKPPCQPISSSPGVSTVPPASGGSTSPSVAMASPATGNGTSPSPSVSQFPESNSSPSPSVSSTLGGGGGSGPIACSNVQVKNIFYNLASTKPIPGAKVHIKCGSSKGGKNGGSGNKNGNGNGNSGGSNGNGNGNSGGNGNGNSGGNNTVNPNNGLISKLINLLIQLIQQLIQLIEQCTGQTVNVTIPTISGIPSISVPSVSTTVQNPSISPASGNSPAPSTSAAPSAAPSGSGSNNGGGSSNGGTGTGTGGGANMVVGFAENGVNGQAAPMAGAVNYVRLQTSFPDPTTDFFSHGYKIDVLFAGPYKSNGIAGLGSPTTWANNALSWYKSHGCTPTNCPMIEVLNEPGGHWFWGGSALSSANEAAYGALLQATYTAFNGAYGTNRPKILASYDGGVSNSVGFGQGLWKVDPSVKNYIDGVTIHPYGGHGSTSAQGNRADVTAAHTQTGLPVYVTELGWPTAVGKPATGDSLQWSLTQQCNNVYNFITWARSTGYVNAVFIFSYKDFSSNMWYGMFTTNGTQKPAYNALKAAAHNQPNPC